MELARNLRRDTVSQLQPTAPRSVEISATVADAVRTMQQENIGCVLVCDGGKLGGIFTERDLVTRVLSVAKPLTTPIRECMTATLDTVRNRDCIRLAVKRMEEGGHRHLPVVDDEGRPVGVLSVKRIVHYLVEHYPSAVYNIPPKPDMIPDQAEGA